MSGGSWQLDGIAWSKDYDNHAEHQVFSHGHLGSDQCEWE